MMANGRLRMTASAFALAGVSVFASKTADAVILTFDETAFVHGDDVSVQSSPPASIYQSFGGLSFTFGGTTANNFNLAGPYNDGLSIFDTGIADCENLQDDDLCSPLIDISNDQEKEVDNILFVQNSAFNFPDDRVSGNPARWASPNDDINGATIAITVDYDPLQFQSVVFAAVDVIDLDQGFEVRDQTGTIVSSIGGQPQGDNKLATLTQSISIDPGDTVYVHLHSSGAIDNLQFDTVTPTDTSPVPVPAALPLFATALAGVGFLGWRKRRAA